MAYRQQSWSSDWPALGMFASAILGVGLLVLGVAIGIGGGDVPDAWVRADAEIVDPPPGFRSGRLLHLRPTERFIRFEDADGALVEHRCDYCWGGIGDEISIAYDPERPANVRHLHFHRIAALAFIVAGLAFLGVGVWWSSRRSARARREAGERPYGLAR